MMKYYKQDEDGNPVEVASAVEADYGESRRVAWDELDGVVVSTVFLPFDHSFLGNDVPTLWETMVFGGNYDGYQERYTSRKEALEGHERIVEGVKKETLTDA